MEGDIQIIVRLRNQDISIHSLRMEGDTLPLQTAQEVGRFQSTPSAWRETLVNTGAYPVSVHFNPLPPHGGRLSYHTEPANRDKFQSTPSAWRETYRCAAHDKAVGDFNPLPPHGGRHGSVRRIPDLCGISIHSLRMEGDLMVQGIRRLV